MNLFIACSWVVDRLRGKGKEEDGEKIKPISERQCVMSKAFSGEQDVKGIS